MRELFVPWGKPKDAFAFGSMGDLGGSTMYRIAEQTAISASFSAIQEGWIALIVGFKPPLTLDR